MNGLIKTSFWLILICGLSAFLLGLGLVTKMVPVYPTLGGPNWIMMLGKSIVGLVNLILGALLIISAMWVRQDKTRQLGGIIALVIGFILCAFDPVGTEGGTYPILLIASVLALTHLKS
jgi:L-cystine uptake protein TcyP (sodium:dicarboxylate symporter family)